MRSGLDWTKRFPTIAADIGFPCRRGLHRSTQAFGVPKPVLIGLRKEFYPIEAWDLIVLYNKADETPNPPGACNALGHYGTLPQ